ncbi:MAG: CBS domain-containing protein [Pseudomonadota bacterium]
MNLASLCTREVISISADASLHEAAVLMCEEHVGALVVVTSDEPAKVVGVVTDRDLALETLGRESPGSALVIGNLVRGQPLAVSAEVGVREAAASMEKDGVRRLLVLDDDGGVVGIVSADDLIHAIADDLATLSKSLRSGIAREKNERRIFSAVPRPVAVFPGFGMAAVQ